MSISELQQVPHLGHEGAVAPLDKGHPALHLLVVFDEPAGAGRDGGDKLDAVPCVVEGGREAGWVQLTVGKKRKKRTSAFKKKLFYVTLTHPILQGHFWPPN